MHKAADGLFELIGKRAIGWTISASLPLCYLRKDGILDAGIPKKDDSVSFRHPSGAADAIVVIPLRQVAAEIRNGRVAADAMRPAPKRTPLEPSLPPLVRAYVVKELAYRNFRGDVDTVPAGETYLPQPAFDRASPPGRRHAVPSASQARRASRSRRRRQALSRRRTGAAQSATLSCGVGHVIETTFPTQSRLAQFRASSFDAVDNTIELTFATSTPVRRRSSYGDYYDEVLTISADAIDISRIDAGSVPLLNSHRIESLADVVGNILPNTVRIATGAASVRAKLSTARGDADVVTKVRDGVITSCSVGYAINQFNIEDRAGDVPVRRITKWTVLEISLVATPADPFAKIRGGELYGAALQAMPRNRTEFVCEPFSCTVIPG